MGSQHTLLKGRLLESKKASTQQLLPYEVKTSQPALERDCHIFPVTKSDWMGFAVSRTPWSCIRYYFIRLAVMICGGWKDPWIKIWAPPGRWDGRINTVACHQSPEAFLSFSFCWGYPEARRSAQCRPKSSCSPAFCWLSLRYFCAFCEKVTTISESVAG